MTVRSTDPNDPATVSATVIDCQGSNPDPHRAFLFINDEGNNSILNGISITNGYASGVYPANSGGAIFCDNNAAPTLMNCNIYNNTAVNGGGALFCQRGSLKISNCIISGNISEDNGGGIWFNNNSTAEVSNCIISDNVAAASGGGIACFFNNVTISECIFTGNSSGSDGGGFYSLYSDPTIQFCTFANNVSESEGGGIACQFDSPVIQHCSILGNIANQAGGIYLYSTSNSTINNCIFAGNLAERNGGIYVNNSNSSLISNCSIVDNTSTHNQYGSGGFYCYRSMAALTNSILWGNIGALGDQIALEIAADPSELTVSYCDVQGGQGAVYVDTGCTLTWQTGNIDLDPNFVATGYWDDNSTPGDEADDFWVDGDYRVQLGSPCIDAGDPNYVPSQNDIDLAGKDRIINGIVDMGAYESLFRDILLTKMTCKAGKTRGADADSISFQGSFTDADAYDFTSAVTVTVQVGSYSKEIPVTDFDKKGKNLKYNYKGGKEGITSVKLDFTKNTFSVSAKNLDLSGLVAPVSVVIEFGDHIGLGSAQDDSEQDVINGKKSLPMQLLSGNTNGLRVDKVVCKADKENKIGNLLVKGAIAAADDIDLATTSLLLHWGATQYPVGVGEFELKGKTKYQYKKSPDDDDPANIVISIDLVKCTFQVTAKKTLWPWEDSPLTFGMAFDSFYETEQVMFSN
ncbi:MAG: hypothetical protein DRP09_18970 [Candidatus Thorarchaeota archaeon]|nr:MAG: hypothetical protein DRP09_18970 [Candidatus Thorarchaeota archaeon]